jgi:hypothetical protein
MNVIFLDIDGVLNNQDSLFLSHFAKSRPTGNVTIRTMSFDAVRMLRYLIKVSDSKIVLTSNWRLLNSNILWRAFKYAGWLDAKKSFIGATKDLGNRGKEIESWLKDHPEIKNYLILDDNSKEITQQTHYVPVDPASGLDSKVVLKSLKKLGIGHIVKTDLKMRGKYGY